ncbi:unnamed protein product [Closterium sp. NIES-54]
MAALQQAACVSLQTAFTGQRLSAGGATAARVSIAAPKPVAPARALLDDGGSVGIAVAGGGALAALATVLSLADPEKRRQQQAEEVGGNEMDAVRNYFNTAGYDRWRRIYGETDDVNSVQVSRAGATRATMISGEGLQAEEGWEEREGEKGDGGRGVVVGGEGGRGMEERGHERVCWSTKVTFIKLHYDSSFAFLLRDEPVPFMNRTLCQATVDSDPTYAPASSVGMRAASRALLTASSRAFHVPPPPHACSWTSVKATRRPSKR